LKHSDGILSNKELDQSADFIESAQLNNGLILWHENGHADPWNHVEAAMALSACKRHNSAEKAYEWLKLSQLPNGGWWNYYTANGVKDLRIDTNVCAYIAVGIWHHYLNTLDFNFVEYFYPVVEKAVEFVLGFQCDSGEVIWCREPEGQLGSYALLTGSCSILLSLRCGISLARILGYERPDWELAATKLAYAIARHEEYFEPKILYAMDWYYPVLSGALDKCESLNRIKESWTKFVMKDKGVRCVSNRDWVTAAETAECALALNALGENDAANQLLKTTSTLRLADGSYYTGLVYPQLDTFPPAEKTTYSAAAIILANQALTTSGKKGGIWRGEGLMDVSCLLDAFGEASEYT
jgi:hypothetical protein